MFQTAIKPLVRGKSVSVWDDSKIKSGDLWKDEIKNALASAKVAVLLVTPDFLASDFITSEEFPPLLEAARTEGLRILWVAVRHSLYQETEIRHYQAVNDPSRPLAGLTGSSRDGEIVKICMEIKSAAGADETQAAPSKGESLPVAKSVEPAPKVAGGIPVEKDTPQEPRRKDIPREPPEVEKPAEVSAPPENAPKVAQPVEHVLDVSGDLLTLAEETPTPDQRAELLWRAAEALRRTKRFSAALTVIDELLTLDGKHRDALMRRGFVLMRLGRLDDAKFHMQAVEKLYEGDTEAQGILGHVYKDIWRMEWKDGKTVRERQQMAVAASYHLVSAVKSYEKAVREKVDYNNGINIISAVRLLGYLAEATGDRPAKCEVAHFDDLVSAVRFSAQSALDGATPHDSELVWANDALAELELVTGDARRARYLYREAAYAFSAWHASVKSMLERVRLFESLGFRPDAVAPVVELLRAKLEDFAQRAGQPIDLGRRFGKVVVASGHLTDAPDRAAKGRGERFPESKVGAVREMVAAQLDKWKIGEGDLAICGGARGADLIFGELCADRGAEVWLLLALPEGEFLDESVRSPGTDWAERFYALKARKSVKTFFQQERLKSPPKGTSVFARNNIWMVNTARVEADKPENLYAVLVWDEQPTGDGPGGTSDFALRVKRLGGHLCDPIINPTKL